MGGIREDVDAIRTPEGGTVRLDMIKFRRA